MDSVGDPTDDDLAAVDQSAELQDDWSLHKGTPPASRFLYLTVCNMIWSKIYKTLNVFLYHAFKCSLYVWKIKQLYPFQNY